MGIENTNLFGNPYSGVNTAGPNGTNADASVDAPSHNDAPAENPELSSGSSSALLTSSPLAEMAKITKDEGKQGSVSSLKNYSAFFSNTGERAHDIATDEGGGRLMADIHELREQAAFEAAMEAAASSGIQDKSGEVDLKSLSDGEFLTLMRGDTGPDLLTDVEKDC